MLRSQKQIGEQIIDAFASRDARHTDVGQAGASQSAFPRPPQEIVGRAERGNEEMKNVDPRQKHSGMTKKTRTLDAGQKHSGMTL